MDILLQFIRKYKNTFIIKSKIASTYKITADFLRPIPIFGDLSILSNFFKTHETQTYFHIICYVKLIMSPY